MTKEEKDLKYKYGNIDYLKNPPPLTKKYETPTLEFGIIVAKSLTSDIAVSKSIITVNNDTVIYYKNLENQRGREEEKCCIQRCGDNG